MVSVDCHIDYIRYRFKQCDYAIFTELKSILSSISSHYVSFGSFQIAKGTKAFKSCLRGHGYKFIYNIDKDSEGKKELFSGYLEFTGKFFEKVSNPQRYDILRKIYLMSGGVSRIDCASDFYGYPSDLMDNIKRDYYDENYRGVINTKYDESSRLIKGKRCYFPTINFGSRESARMLRIYPTLNTHDYDAIRFEVELKREYSELFCKDFFNSPVYLDSHKSQIFSVSMNTVSFGQRLRRYVEGKQVRIFEPSQWYSDLLHLCNNVCERLKIEKSKPDLHRTINWLLRSVSKPFYLLKKIGKGSLFKIIDTMLSIGEKNFSDEDKWKIKNYSECDYTFEENLLDYIENSNMKIQSNCEAILNWWELWCPLSDDYYRRKIEEKYGKKQGHNVSQLVLEYWYC